MNYRKWSFSYKGFCKNVPLKYDFTYITWSNLMDSIHIMCGSRKFVKRSKFDFFFFFFFLFFLGGGGGGLMRGRRI